MNDAGPAAMGAVLVAVPVRQALCSSMCGACLSMPAACLPTASGSSAVQKAGSKVMIARARLHIKFLAVCYLIHDDSRYTAILQERALTELLCSATGAVLGSFESLLMVFCTALEQRQNPLCFNAGSCAECAGRPAHACRPCGLCAIRPRRGLSLP